VALTFASRPDVSAPWQRLFLVPFASHLFVESLSMWLAIALMTAVDLQFCNPALWEGLLECSYSPLARA
jgi:hypothetical protein